jgi:hypothetical protein
MIEGFLGLVKGKKEELRIENRESRICKIPIPIAISEVAIAIGN